MSNKIEKIAVRKIEEVVDNSAILEAYIDSNDKFPMWDGNILVYSSGNIENKHLKGKIPVQVKGRSVKKFSGSTIKYSFKVTDLESYLRDGGVLFFVVEILNDKETKIYYSNLLPIDIDDLLLKKKKKQNNISSELKFLNESKSSYIESICEEFLFHRNRQYSTIKYRIPVNEMKDLDKLNISIFSPKEELETYLFRNEVVLYGQRKNEKIQLPIAKIKPELIKFSVDSGVYIKDKLYFDKYKVQRGETKEELIIGDNIIINLTEGKFDFKLIGSLNIRLKETKFLIDIIKYSCFNIDGIKAEKIRVNKEQKKIIEEHYHYLKDIEKLLEFFNIDKDLDLDSLTDKEHFILELLINNVLYNKTEKYNIENSEPIIFNIGNINIAAFTEVNEFNEMKIYNFFDINKKIKGQIKSKEGNIIEEGCIFTILKAADIIKIDNLKLDVIQESIKKVPHSNLYSEHVNMLVLELIKAYDINEDLAECLNVAINLSEWLEHNNQDSVIYKMNKFQVYKRLRDLNEDEKTDIINIRETFKDDYFIQCGTSILLDNKSDFSYYFEKLDKSDKDIFKEFPIYKLK